MSDALTGESFPGALISETNPPTQTYPSIDISIDTNAEAGVAPGVIIIPTGRIVLLTFTPRPCGSRPECVPLASPISYVWGDTTDRQALPQRSFYRPTESVDTPDTQFILRNGVMQVRVNEAGNFAVTDVLGERGWTLPYDATTLCAQATCAGGGPRRFISAGVQSQPAQNGNDGNMVIPTYAFKGSVALPSAWGALTWDGPGLTLRFKQAKTLDVANALNTSGTTLTAADVAQGWGGLRFNAGSGGTLDSSFVERVRAYGGAAVTITGASPTIRGTQIRDSPCCGVTGVSISGNGASPVLRGNSITRMSGDGVSVYDYVQPRLIQNQITDNAGDGIKAGYQSTVFLAPEAETAERVGNDVLRNSYGVYASNSAYVNYSWYYYSGSEYYNDGYNNVFDNNANGNVATSNAAIVAGNSGNQRRNGFYRNARFVTGGLDAQATGTGSRAYVNCNFWGPGSAPPFRTEATGGASLFNASYLADDPRTVPLAPCLPFGRSARGTAGSSITGEDGLALVADAASMEDPVEALAVLEGLIDEGGALVAPGLAEVGRLAMRPSAPAEAIRLLEAYAAGGDAVARSAALTALVGAYGATADTPGSLRAAEALVATQEPEAMLFGQIARVSLLTEAGQMGAAIEALAAARSLAPRAVEVEMARSHAERASGTVLTANEAARPALRTTAGRQENAGNATEAALGAVQPNPASRMAVVPLSLPAASHVRLALYDVLGREAAVVLNGRLERGDHRLAFDAGTLAPGVYLLRAIITAEGGVASYAGRVTVTR